MLVSPSSSSSAEPLGIWFSSAASTRLPAHSHAGAELNLMMAGEARYETSQGSHTLPAGRLFVLPAGLEHEMTWASADMAMWVIELPRTMPGASKVEWLDRCAMLTPSDAFRRMLVHHVRKLWLRPSEKRTMELRKALFDLLIGIELASELPPVRQSPAVERARWLCENERGAIPIRELCRRTGVSSSRLAHLFQTELGVTPLQYRNFARLQRFIRMHDERSPNLLQSALTSGFGSYAQFHRIFHQVCGASPCSHFRWLDRHAGIDPARTMG